MNKMLLPGLCALAVAIGCTGDKDKKRGDEVELPGDEFYPESLTGDSEGNLYTGSIVHGQVVKISPSGGVSMYITSSSSPGLTGVTGVLVDEPRDRFWLCAIDFFALPPVETLREYDLHDGSELATYSFPGFWLCNDIAVDATGKPYIADSAGRILTTSTGSQLVTWLSHALIAPAGTAGLASFGVDGIVWEGETLWVNNLSKSSIVKIPRVASGTAGAPVQIAVTPPISFPDGMRLDGAGSLVVAEGIGNITRITITGTTGTSTVIANGFDGPTSVFRSTDGLWISEGQLGHLFGFTPGPPTVPFRVVKIEENP